MERTLESMVMVDDGISRLESQGYILKRLVHAGNAWP